VEPIETGRARKGIGVAAVVLVGVAGLAALGTGLYLGVGDLVERHRESVSNTTVASSTTTIAGPAATTVVTDDSGRLVIVVPAAWADVDGGPWYRGDAVVGIQIGAAVDLDAWTSGWGTPGVFVGVSDTLTLADGYGDWSDECRRDEDEPFVADGISGTIHRWVDCGAEGSTFLDGAAMIPGRAELFRYQAVLLDGGDRAASNRVLNTLRYLR
jgi:hypothetical protein